MKKGIIILTIAIGLLILLSDEVKAVSLTTPVIKDGEFTLHISNDSQFTSESEGYSTTITSADNIQQVNWYWSEPYDNTTNKEFFSFVFLMSEALDTTSTSSLEGRRCLTWTCNQYCASGACAGMCEKYQCTQYGTWTEGSTTTYYNNDSPNMGISFKVVYTNGQQELCTIDGNNVYCPIYNRQVNRISLNINFKNASTTNFKININRRMTFWKSMNIEQAITNQTQEIINQNATYSDTPSKDLTNETQELEDYEQAEQNLINSLDLNMSVMDGITINPNASAYIWQIVDRLRQINPAIILLMTSILGMGIIKMVLNR